MADIRVGRMPGLPNGAILTVGGTYAPGSRPPITNGYSDREDWYWAQRKAGLKQVPCGNCGKYCFPQELSGKTRTRIGFRHDRQRQRIPVEITEPTCKECDPPPPTRGQADE